MADRPAVHLTPELELDLSDRHSLTLRYPGDVHLSQTFGRPLAGAQVGGDLVMDLPRVTGTCVAQGAVRSASPVDAIRLTGRELHLSGGEIRARALSATERILIGPCTLKVDVIIAPVVIIDPAATGRVTVVESRNEQGPSKIRGAFSLEEYEENFGGALEFLASRGVGPLDDGVNVDELLERPRAIVTTAPLDPATETEPVELDVIDLEPIDDDPDADITLDGEVSTPLDVLAANDETAGFIAASSELPPRAPTPEPPPQRVSAGPAVSGWFRKLDRLVADIEKAYGSQAPDSIQALRELIEERQPATVNHGLDAAWTDTVRHHRQAREPVDPRVAHRFRVLHELVTHGP